MSAPRILAFSGSLRAGSFNRQLLQLGIAAAREAGAVVTEVDLRNYPLPLFDEDIEARGTPENALKLKELFLANEGLLLASPEYNSMFSGVMKNTIDWVSRPIPGKPRLACYVGKVAALMSASPGALGGLRGLFVMRTLLSNINVLVLPDQVTLSQANEAFTPDGSLKDTDKQKAVQTVARKLVEVVGKLYPG